MIHRKTANEDQAVPKRRREREAELTLVVHVGISSSQLSTILPLFFSIRDHLLLPPIPSCTLLYLLRRWCSALVARARRGGREEVGS